MEKGIGGRAAAAGGSLAVALGLVAAGILIVKDSHGEISDLVTVAMRAQRAELVRFAGGPPDRCVFASPGRELCRWRLEGRVVTPAGSEPLVGPQNLVCELPRDPSSEDAGSCFVRGAAAAPQDEALPPVSSPGDPRESARHAAMILAEARNVGELSLLVGDVPDGCHTVYRGQICTWSLAPGSAAYERLAALAQGEGALELRCVLPLEAVDRAGQSCAVVAH